MHFIGPQNSGLKKGHLSSLSTIVVNLGFQFDASKWGGRVECFELRFLGEPRYQSSFALRFIRGRGTKVFQAGGAHGSRGMKVF